LNKFLENNLILLKNFYTNDNWNLKYSSKPWFQIMLKQGLFI
jgi:hypothetical protein